MPLTLGLPERHQRLRQLWQQSLLAGKFLHCQSQDLWVATCRPLGRFGVFEIGDKKIFFIAGAWSIDQAYRTPGLSWWAEEELNFTEAEECLNLWESVCKDIDLVISHDGPPNFTQHIKNVFPIETHTGRLLWEMYKIHQPPLWRIGHWHKSFEKKIGNTIFKCLDINEEEILEFK